MTLTDWTKVFSFPLLVCVIFLVPQILLYWELIALSIVVVGTAVFFLAPKDKKQ